MTRRTASPFLNAHAFAASQGLVEYIDSTNSVTTRYYYDGSNVIVETDESDAVQRAYMHGTQYIDERAVIRSYDVGPEDHYYLLEELYTVAGLADPNGGLAEAVVYDTYGGARIYAWPVGDLDWDGDVDAADESIMSSAISSSGTDVPTDYPFADLDHDGDADNDDANLMPEASGADRTVEVTYSGLDNPYFFTGRITDTWHASSLLVSEDPDYRRVEDIGVAASEMVSTFGKGKRPAWRAPAVGFVVTLSVTGYTSSSGLSSLV